MITKEDLLNWLKEIDSKLSKKMIIVAVGGTAMTLLGLKPSTKDVDFCLNSKDEKVFRKLSADSKFKVDLFKDGYIFSEQLPEDYIKKSNKIKINFVNLDLRILSPVDIIITKTARLNERDEEDISTLAKTNKIKRKELEERFEQVKESYAGNEEDYKYHFELVLKRHFSNTNNQ